MQDQIEKSGQDQTTNQTTRANNQKEAVQKRMTKSEAMDFSHYLSVSKFISENLLYLLWNLEGPEDVEFDPTDRVVTIGALKIISHLTQQVSEAVYELDKIYRFLEKEGLIDFAALPDKELS